MRFTPIHALAALLPAAASAAGTLGFALGVQKADASCKAQADFEADFDAIASASSARIVRTYSASNCNSLQFLLPAAAAKGFQVIPGIWPDTDQQYAADLAAIQQYAPQYASTIYAVTVGSETLYRGSFTGPTLWAKMSDAKSTLGGNIKIGTADSWNKFADGTADAVIQGGPDLLLCNGFAFWQASPINNASHVYLDDMVQAYNHIQSVAGNNNIELWTGETGWPTDTKDVYGASQGGTQQAQTFWQQGVCAALAWGFNVFYFEAFDEPFKPDAIGTNGQIDDETHWGAMTVDRVAKFPLSC